MKEKYIEKAEKYAEKYGITQFNIRNNLMIYYENYPSYLKEKKYTIKVILNLSTMKETRTRLKKYKILVRKEKNNENNNI